VANFNDKNRRHAGSFYLRSNFQGPPRIRVKPFPAASTLQDISFGACFAVQSS
jgi:hypothetical protein